MGTDTIASALEALKQKREQLDAELADSVLELLDHHGLGQLVRARVLGGRARLIEQVMAAKVEAKQSKRTRPTAAGSKPTRRNKPGGTCSDPGCDGAGYCKGLCRKHYDDRRLGRTRPSGAKRKASPAADDEGEPVSSSVIGACTADGCTRKVWQSGAWCRDHDPGRLRLGEGTDEDLSERSQLQAEGAIGNPLQMSDEMPLGASDRKTDCVAYNRCLSFVNRQGWKRWSCAGCKGPGLQNAQIGQRRARTG